MATIKVREALVVIWEAGDRICGKRLQAVLPTQVEAIERHGHLNLDPSVRARLLSVSASTIDRLLAPMRAQVRIGNKRRSSPKKASMQISLRTFADWKEVDTIRVLLLSSVSIDRGIPDSPDELAAVAKALNWMQLVLRWQCGYRGRYLCRLVHSGWRAIAVR
jgi:hypothetical protein